MSFQVPYSSSLPSTPDRKSNNAFSYGASNPSTTPAGPPPSSTGCFTPAGLPPTSFLGSSIMESPIKPPSFTQQRPSPNKFGYPESSPAGGYVRSQPRSQRSGLGNEYQAPAQRGFQVPSDGSEEDEEEAEYSEEENGDGQDYGDEDEMAEQDGMYDDDQDMDEHQSDIRGSRSDRQTYNHDMLLSTQNDQGRSMFGFKDSIAQPLSGGPDPTVYAQIAKDAYTELGLPVVSEGDDLILSTEVIITRLYEEGVGVTTNDEMLQNALATIPEELIKLWLEYQRETTIYHSEEYTAKIGPGPSASDFAKANFLGGLTLQIRHPQVDLASYGRRLKPLPQTLLEWMDEHHDPYPSQFEEILANRPSPSNHQHFWEIIFSGLLRGKVVAVVDLMSQGGWKYARGGPDDSSDRNGQVGYTGVTLPNVEKVVMTATQVLAQCPATHGDWSIQDSDWTLFRLRVSQARDDLRSFAEGRDRSAPDYYDPDGFSSQPGTYSTTAKKAQSRVPWHIYQNLLTLYNFVMGDKDAIISNAQDWCEATIGLLAWWDEGKEDRRVALGKSQNSYRASSRHTDDEMYLRKLRKAFELATHESTEFHIDTLAAIEVGLASLFEGDIESVIGFLRAWSGPVSSAVVEIGSLGGWLPRTEPQSLINMGSLDDEDFDVLGINSSPSKLDGIKDQTLIVYARELIKRKELKASKRSGNPEIAREGWELAFSVVGRLDSAARSEEVIGEFLKSFDLDSSDTVNKLWRILNDIGMGRHAESTAETYADLLAEGSHKYGEALWYYALSHKTSKVKDVLDLLISYSLIQSVAYPTEYELDEHLKRLIHTPKVALQEISRMDVESAEILHKMLSGYATLRRFYTLRDEEVLSPKGKSTQMGARVRKAEATSALMAVITSSDDNIRGGLYDEERGPVVSVDFLLALLGEAMVFVNQPGSAISVPDIDILLKAIEDVQAVGPRVYSACTEFLQTVIASGQGLKGSSPADMLRKSTSNLSGTSSFSMVGSSILASQLKQSMGSSGILVKGNIKRGWDWRQGISAGTNAEDLLKILRLGLAKDLAKAWLIEADNTM